MVGEQLLRQLDCLRVQSGAGEFVHGAFHNRRLLGCHRPVMLQLREPRQLGF
jgi:hypothetical protein